MVYKAVIGQNKFLKYHVMVFIFFAVLYHYFKQEEDKESLKTFEDALYFSIVNHFTVGFGDITPKSKTLRRLCMLQIILAFVFFAS